MRRRTPVGGDLILDDDKIIGELKIGVVHAHSGQGGSHAYQHFSFPP
jgi:hypothetical protein